MSSLYFDYFEALKWLGKNPKMYKIAGYNDWAPREVHHYLQQTDEKWQEYKDLLDVKYKEYVKNRWKSYNYVAIITTPEQGPYLKVFMELVGEHNVFYKCPYVAVNGNYPESGPRLNLYIFKGKEMQ